MGKSAFTRVGFFSILFAGINLAYLGFRRLNDTEPFWQRFAAICIMESMFAFAALLFADLILYGYQRRKFLLVPDFKKVTYFETFRNFAVLFILLGITQTFMILPLAEKDFQLALAYVSAAPAEEAFFRILIIGFFIRIGQRRQTKFDFLKKEMSPIEAFGIILSSILFMLIHSNYYGNYRVLAGVFVSGLILGLGYWYTQDDIAIIGAHFVINLIVAIRTFGIEAFFYVQLG